MREHISREAAWAALRRYNQEPFHLQHALTVEGVMQWYAKELGYGDDAEFWGIVGLLHDIDFERWPEEHCQKAPELLREIGCSDELIHAARTSSTPCAATAAACAATWLRSMRWRRCCLQQMS